MTKEARNPKERRNPKRERRTLLENPCWCALSLVPWALYQSVFSCTYARCEICFAKCGLRILTITLPGHAPEPALSPEIPRRIGGGEHRAATPAQARARSEEHTSELQSHSFISY